MTDKPQSKKKATPAKAKSKAKLPAKRKKAEAKPLAPQLTVKERLHLAAVWLGKSLAKLSLGVVIGLFIYVIYLDAKVTRTFEGSIWQIPAQVYAKPLTLSVGMPLTQQSLEQEVMELNYRRVDTLGGPGEYTLAKQHLSLVRRGL